MAGITSVRYEISCNVAVVMRFPPWACLKPVHVFSRISPPVIFCPHKILSAVLNILKDVKEVRPNLFHSLCWLLNSRLASGVRSGAVG